LAVKAVLSDLGGVLIDYSFDLATAEWARLASVDAHALAERLVVDEAWEQFEVGGLTEKEFCSHLRQQCGLDLTDDELIHGWNSPYIGVNHDVEGLLRDAADQGVRVVAVTNTNVTHQRVWRGRFAGSLDFFAAIYSSWEIRLRKPDPAFFEHVLMCEHLVAREVLFIDDIDANVAAADSLEIDAILYTCVDSLRDALASRRLLAKGSSL
jgi:HAD superfamily hydrolase (TIGR01509 family)